MRATPEDDGELAKTRGELAEARAELDALRKAGRESRVSVATLIVVEPGLVSRVESLEARKQELSTPPALSVSPPGEDAALRWNVAPIPARRQVALLLCTPSMFGELRVRRSPSPGHRVSPEDRRDVASWLRHGS